MFNFRLWAIRALLGTAACAGTWGLNAASGDGEWFAAKIGPILEAHCLKCHSHAAGKMKGGLTLDSRSGWAEGGDNGAAIVPGKPADSILIRAVSYDDSDLQMPPKGKLSAAEIGLLVEWVKRGAPDPRETKSSPAVDADWWSLRKLVGPKVPGDGHPIDAFIRKRLQSGGLKPAGQADRITLARRLYVDLHGYLPTPEEVSVFVGNKDSKAYPKLVDELLASPRYGERWARHWLDVIHFADSHGCEHDVKRPNAWRFRDYVIERLNTDVPWGRFIREQLATDVFYPDEPQLTPALGFISAGPLELSRAGTAPVTFDYLDRDDMVTQTMAAFVSTTANCARCHTHKFDPITQEDYYALQAVFAGIGKGDVDYDTSAAVMHRRTELNELLVTADPRILLQEKYAQVVSDWASRRARSPVEWEPLNPDVFIASGGATLSKRSDGSIFVSGKAASRENYTVTSRVGLKQLTAVRLDVLKDKRLPKGGPGRAGNGNMHLTDVELQWFPAGASAPLKLKVARASADFDQNGWTAIHAIDGDVKTGWAIYPKVNESHHLVLELAKPLDVTADGRLAVILKQYPPTHLIGNFKLSVTDAGNGAAQVLPMKAKVGLGKISADRTEDERAAIARVALLQYARKEMAELPAKTVAYGVSRYWSHAKKKSQPLKPKVVHLLRRGAFDRPVREVGPGSLSAINGLPGRFKLSDPQIESARRAALADWLAHPDNPLTWRSIVNRVWHFHFGRGLSDTPNDFGRMGSKPTHPELLDWLAVWFRDEAKGSLKDLHRLILTSDTWQQASDVRGTGKDSGNLWLWRMNRRRIDADVYRDSALRIAGRLDLKMGGPGIEQFTKSKGQQATPKLDYAGFDWNSADARRRSIYRVVWRGIADPFMEALDFPDLGLLAPKRSFSVSALQSLAVFNNDFVLHASEWIAGRLNEERKDQRAQIDWAVKLAWSRQPSEKERTEYLDYSREFGLAAFCRLLLNSNEMLLVD
jgi:mono/diheme cytochrome c family protein